MLIDSPRDLAGVHILKIIKDYPEVIPLVKTASYDESEFNALPDTAFAWPEKRAFPIHTKEHAALSRLYKTACEKVPSYVEDNIKKACEIYDLPEAVFNKTEIKTASTKKITLEEATEKLMNKNTSLVGRAKIATYMAQDSSTLPEKVASYVQTYSGQVACDRNALVDWVQARAEAVKSGPHKEAYSKLASDLTQCAPVIYDRDSLIKLAESIFDMDTSSKLTSLYNKKLLNPMETVFNTTEKLAQDYVDLNGRSVPVAKLASYSLDFYSDILGDDLAKEASSNGEVDIEKLAAILETLPRDIKDCLVREMRL